MAGDPGASMYLRNVRLRNFRSFDSGVITFQKHLTVLVGENNGGKSNVIDALRLLTLPLGGRREIYCEQTDVRFQSGSDHFELEAHFAELSSNQQGRFISAATDASLANASFGLRYNAVPSGARPLLWGGKEGNAPEVGCHDMVRHVYLPPLRDAKRALASGNPTRIMALLNHFLGGSTPDQLAKELSRSKSHEVLTKVDGAVEKSLAALTSGVRRQSAALGFASDEGLLDIARDLRFKMADHGVAPEDLQYSGHGYANLLYMAIIAVELERVRTVDLTIFLVEEPEAHLHPQLQAAVLAFLQEQAEQSRSQPPSGNGPAGELQVVVATHSPNLSAWVSSERLVVFRSVLTTTDQTAPIEPPVAVAAAIEKVATNGETPDVTEGVTAAATATAIRRSTRCIPLAEMPLDKVDRRKVDRYIDVTKAALLFGGRVLLVEGIAEGLLLPVIAKHYTLKDLPDKLRLFRSAVFIPIDGVDFSPYTTLLLTPVNEARIADRVVVMTDGDKGVASDDDVEDGESDSGAADAGSPDAAENSEEGVPEPVAPEVVIPGEKRKADLEALASSLGAANHFAAITSTYSLEAELLEAGNGAILEKAYLALHPKSKKTWKNAVALIGDERAKAIHKIFKSTRKGDFAQLLARLIEDGETFYVPTYITKAIEEVVAT